MHGLSCGGFFSDDFRRVIVGHADSFGTTLLHDPPDRVRPQLQRPLPLGPQRRAGLLNSNPTAASMLTSISGGMWSGGSSATVFAPNTV